jgi:hypothetical protein
MLIFQPPVNFCSDKNIQTIFGTKLEDFLNYRIDYDLISQTVEKVVKIVIYDVSVTSGILFCKWGRLGNERSELTNPTNKIKSLLTRPSYIYFYTTGLHCIKKRSRIFDVYFNFCGKNQVVSLVLTFVY